MRFSTLIAFILPLSALAAPALVIPNENDSNLRKLVEEIKKASVIYGETFPLLSDGSKLSRDVAFLQGTIATIPISGVMDKIIKAIEGGQKPAASDLDLIDSGLNSVLAKAAPLSASCDSTVQNVCSNLSAAREALGGAKVNLARMFELAAVA